MIRLISITFITTILSFSSFSALAEISRSCEAKYILSIYNNSGKFLANQAMHTFTAKGICGNKSVANRCRERARSSALHCMEYHLNNDYRTAYPNLDNMSVPYYCSNRKHIYNYKINDLSELIHDTACMRAKQLGHTGFTIVQVVARISGNTGCKKQTTIHKVNEENTEKWVINCS